MTTTHKKEKINKLINQFHYIMQQKKIRSFSAFQKELYQNPELQELLKQDPVGTLKRFQQDTPWFNDKLIYRLVVLFLGIIVLTICIGVIYLTADGIINTDFDVPDILIATASTAIGAIAGLLTPTNGSNQPN